MTMLRGSQIDRYRLRVLEQAIRLECLGMKRHGTSATEIVRREFGIKSRKRAEVLAQFRAVIRRLEEVDL